MDAEALQVKALLYFLISRRSNKLNESVPVLRLINAYLL
jgi:hypothetical protein